MQTRRTVRVDGIAGCCLLQRADAALDAVKATAIAIAAAAAAAAAAPAAVAAPAAAAAAPAAAAVEGLSKAISVLLNSRINERIKLNLSC